MLNGGDCNRVGVDDLGDMGVRVLPYGRSLDGTVRLEVG